MEVDIWSDVRCPFCYIGKHNFEAALKDFYKKDKIQITWHSFELDPALVTEPEVNSIEHFAKIKGVSNREAEAMMDHVLQIAEGTGLEFNFKKAVVANSFKAHQLIQLAKSKGKGNEIEGALFKAHFTDGKNIDDHETLVALAGSVGLYEREVDFSLANDKFADKVRIEEQMAQEIGISAVPFFVFDRKYAVSGAQPIDAFKQVLDKSWEEYQKEHGTFNVQDMTDDKTGPSCTVDGQCD